MLLGLLRILTTILPAVGLHFVGVKQEWYETQGGFWWFDDLTHFVSGFAVTTIILTFLEHWWLILCTFWALTLIWEGFEYGVNEPADMWVSWKNMFYDTVLGTLGASAALTFFYVVLG